MSFKQFLNESTDTGEDTFAVAMLGGSIGSRNVRAIRDLIGVDISDDEQLFSLTNAKAKAKRMNKTLSTAEKRHYGIKFVVSNTENGKYTGSQNALTEERKPYKKKGKMYVFNQPIEISRALTIQAFGRDTNGNKIVRAETTKGVKRFQVGYETSFSVDDFVNGLSAKQIQVLTDLNET